MNAVQVRHGSGRGVRALAFKRVYGVVSNSVLNNGGNLSGALDGFVVNTVRHRTVRQCVSPKSLVVINGQGSVRRFTLRGNTTILVAKKFSASRDVIRLTSRIRVPVLHAACSAFAMTAVVGHTVASRLVGGRVVLIRSVCAPVSRAGFLSLSSAIFRCHGLGARDARSQFPVIGRGVQLINVVATGSVLKGTSALSLRQMVAHSPVITGARVDMTDITRQVV